MKKAIFVLILFVHAGLSQTYINGRVYDTYGQPLAGANVFFVQSKKGTVTGQEGDFRMGCPVQYPDTLVISFIGFVPQKRVLESCDPSLITITLESTVIAMDQIEIESEKPFNRMIPIAPGARNISASEIHHAPVVLYPELNHLLARIPGVTVRNEFSSELYVRGGGSDQNLVLLDGIPVYYPYHLFGLASAFNPDMIDGLTFSPGGFPANFGGRLSSVLSLHSIDPDETLQGSLDLSVLGAAITLARKQNQWLKWSLSFRKSYYQWLLNNIGNGVPYRFKDLFAKISITPVSSSQIDVSFFQFDDDFQDENSASHFVYHEQDSSKYIEHTRTSTDHYGWQNTMMGINWQQSWGKIKSQLLVYQSVAGNRFQKQLESSLKTTANQLFQYYIDLAREDDLAGSHTIENRFRDRTARLEWVVAPDHFQWHSGLEWSEIAFSYGWDQRFTPLTAIFDYQDKVNLFFDYAPDQFSLDKRVRFINGFTLIKTTFHPWDFQLGLRTTHLLPSRHWTLEPRLNIVFEPNSNFTYALAIGRVTQPLFTALENGLVTFLPLYFAVHDSLDLPAANHYALGMTYTKDSNFEATMNVYYKAYQNLVQAVGPAPNYRQWPGTSYGLELQVRAHSIKWDLQMALALNKTWRQQNAYKVPANWDQRFRFDVQVTRSIFHRLKISGMWQVASGVPYVSDRYIAGIREVLWNVPLDEQIQDNYDEITVELEPGQIRFPWYHRLDISVSWQFLMFKKDSFVYLSLRNAYARKNVLYYKKSRLSYNTQDGQKIDFHIKNPYQWLPPIPSLGFKVEL